MHYTNEQISTANKKDLIDFLHNRGEQVKCIGQQWMWEKNQVWINGYEWYSHYDCKGGHAVSFVIFYFNLTFQEAIRELLGNDIEMNVVIVNTEKVKKEFTLPKANVTMNRIYAYLMNERFIARDIITYFVRANLIYEDADYHNCVFIGLDENGIPRHAHRRGTSSKGNFKKTDAGSIQKYSFHYIGTSENLFIFEAPIDMLAFITLHQKDWQEHSYVALCCVSEHAILHQLQVNKHLRKVILCLDHDDAGARATNRLRQILSENGYIEVTVLKSINKDWDEDIKSQNGKESVKASEGISEEIIKTLCHELILETNYMKKPPFLFEALQDAYNCLNNISEESLQKQCLHLMTLLFLFAKDECRKSEAGIEWTELENKIIESYVFYNDNGDTACRMRQLKNDMQKLITLYKSNQTLPIGKSDDVLKNILPVIMDCIKIIIHLNKKEGAEVK